MHARSSSRRSGKHETREVESHCCGRGCVSVCKSVRSGKIKTVEIENEQIEGLRTETCVILKFSPRAAGDPARGWRECQEDVTAGTEANEALLKRGCSQRCLCCSSAGKIRLESAVRSAEWRDAVQTGALSAGGKAGSPVEGASEKTGGPRGCSKCDHLFCL